MTSPGLDDSISQRTLLLQNLLRNGRGIGQNTSRKTAKLELSCWYTRASYFTKLVQYQIHIMK